MADLNGNISNEGIQSDVIQEMIGSFGKWQFKISLLMSLLKLPMAWFQLGIVFLASSVDFSCKTPNRTEGKDWILHIEPNSCFLKNMSTINGSYSKIQCNWGYSYDKSMMESNIIMEWNLVCGKQRMIEITQVTFMFGVLLGTVIFGIIADRYGRKTALIISIILQGVCGVASSTVPWFWVFILFRFFLALGNGGTMMSSFVMCMEVVGGPYRTIVPILYQIPYIFGNLIMAILAYLLKDWRNLNLVLSVISCLFFSYIWLIPESPRWLLAVGMRKQALKVLKDAAKYNNRPSIIPLALANSNYGCKEEKENPKFSQLINTSELRKRTFFLCLNWFIMGMIFFALSQYMGSIGTNIYLSVLAAGAFTIPGTILCAYIIRKTGRKTTVTFANLLTTVSVVGIILFPKGQYVSDWPRLALSALGFVGLAISLPALFLFTGELYPTVLRNAGTGGAAMFSKMGSMVAPLLLTLQDLLESLPLIIIGVLGIISVVLVLPLPETAGCMLPDNVQDLRKNRTEDYEIPLQVNDPILKTSESDHEMNG